MLHWLNRLPIGPLVITAGPYPIVTCSSEHWERIQYDPMVLLRVS